MTVGPEREFIGVGEIDDEGAWRPSVWCAITMNTTRSDPQAVSTRVGRASFPLAKSDGDDYDTALISRLN